MATIRKRGKMHFAEVRSRRHGVYVSRTFPTKLQAQAWALSVEQDLGVYKGATLGKTLWDAYERYMREISPTHKGARWEEIRLKKLQRDRLAVVMLANLSTERLQEWVSEQLTVLSPSSVSREFGLISAVLTAARKRWKWMTHSPAADVMKPKKPPPRERRISADEQNRILEALGYDPKGVVYHPRRQVAIAFLLAIETAMRHGELWGLEWRDVNLADRYVVLHDTKNGTSRKVPLTKEAVALLQKLPGGKGRVFPMPKATAEVMFRRAVQLAGIENLHFHDTRHEGLTRLAQKLSMLELARVVGHKDPRSLMIYYNPTVSELAAKLD